MLPELESSTERSFMWRFAEPINVARREDDADFDDDEEDGEGDARGGELDDEFDDPEEIDFGVTSINSSSSIYSSAPSSVNSRGVSSAMCSSAPLERMLVSFFSFVGFTSMSPGREFSPMIIPS